MKYRWNWSTYRQFKYTISINRPGSILFFKTHNSWIIHKRTKIKPYSERVGTFHSEYAFIIVLWQVVQKLCVEKSGYPLVYLSRFYGNLFHENTSGIPRGVKKKNFWYCPLGDGGQKRKKYFFRWWGHIYWKNKKNETR